MYQCPDCGYTSEGPGDCPTCGIPLVESGSESESSDEDEKEIEDGTGY